MTNSDKNHTDWNTYRRSANEGAKSTPLDWLILWPPWATRTLAQWLNSNPIMVLLRALEPFGVLVAVIGIWFAVVQTLSTYEELRHTREQTRLARESFEADRVVREMTLDAFAWEAFERARISPGDVGQYQALAALRETKNGDFTNVNFSRIDFTRADLSNLTLQLAIFDAALLRSADFRGSDLRSARFGDKAALDGADFRGARLKSTRFLTVDLPEARFDNTTLERAEFHGTALGETNFASSRLRKIEISNPELFYTNFSFATLEQVQFTVPEMKGVDFEGATIIASQLTSLHSDDLKPLCPDGSQAMLRRKFWRVNFKDATLTCNDNAPSGGLGCTSLHFVDLLEVNLSHTKFNGTDVSGTDFRRSNVTQRQVAGMCWFADWCPPKLPENINPPPLCELEID